MITFVCEQNLMVWDEFDNRELAKKALKNHIEARKLKCERELRQIYKRLQPLRNSTAHSIETEDNVQSMLRTLADSVSQLEKIIK
jgi:inhibitor of KinA sporulation pathway (predicted exonuclease)